MSELESLSLVLRFLIALSALWLVAFVYFRSYRIEALRERMFALRDELFSCAASGQVAFNDPAYAKLRLLLNSFIRFAHRMTFVRFAIVAWFGPTPPQGMSSPMREWEDAMKELPDDVASKLHSIHRRAEVLIVRHMALGSPLLLTGLLAIGCWLVVAGFVGGATRRFKDALSVLADKLPGFDVFQSRTVLADKRDRQVFHGKATAHG